MRRPQNALDVSGAELDQLTGQLMQASGLGKGMTVLDAGCGSGAVSLLAAGIVGATGSVIGVDRSAGVVATAARRAFRAGITNVRFQTANIADLALAEPVDALVGRMILMHLFDPAVVVRRLAGFVQPGGIVAFHELDFGGTVEHLKQTFLRIGIDGTTGRNLSRIFQEAGLPAPTTTVTMLADVELDATVVAPSLVGGWTRTAHPAQENRIP